LAWPFIAVSAAVLRRASRWESPGVWRSSLPHQEKFFAEVRIMRSAHFVSEVQPITGGAYTAEEIISSKTGQHCCFAA
jgi:hypothetical protein